MAAMLVLRSAISRLSDWQFLRWASLLCILACLVGLFPSELGHPWLSWFDGARVVLHYVVWGEPMGLCGTNNIRLC